MRGTCDTKGHLVSLNRLAGKIMISCRNTDIFWVVRCMNSITNTLLDNGYKRKPEGLGSLIQGRKL